MGAVLTPQQLKVAHDLYGLATRAGLSPQHASEFVAAAYAESKLEPGARNPKSGAAGEFQLLSKGYVDKANALGGVDNPIANAQAILPAYKQYWAGHPNAAPGEGGAAVEASGEGAGFYASPLAVLGGLGGTDAAGAPLDGSGGPGGAGGNPMASLALGLIKSSQDLSAGKPLDVLPSIEALRGAGPMPDTTFQGGGTPGSVKFAAGSMRPGTRMQQPVLDFLGRVSSVAGQSLTVGTGTNHNQFVVGTTRQSDHWDDGNGGRAVDIPAVGHALLHLGQSALIAAGVDPKIAAQQTGGVFNFTVGGHHVQIIFNSNVGGNHFNHLHVAVR